MLIIDKSMIGGAVEGKALVVGKGGTLSQVEAVFMEFGIPVDDGVSVVLDCAEHIRHRVFIKGDRTLVLTNDRVGQQMLLVLCQHGQGGKVVWPGNILWRGGEVPKLSAIIGNMNVITILKLATGIYLGWEVGEFF